MMARTLFPVCASFGPVFMAMGNLFPNRDGFSLGFVVALPGALMVSAALIILFREVVARGKVTNQSVG